MFLIYEYIYKLLSHLLRAHRGTQARRLSDFDTTELCKKGKENTHLEGSHLIERTLWPRYYTGISMAGLWVINKSHDSEGITCKGEGRNGKVLLR